MNNYIIPLNIKYGKVSLEIIEIKCKEKKRDKLAMEETHLP